MALKNKNPKKKCITCGSLRSTSQFYKSTRSKDGFQQSCKACIKKKKSETKTIEKKSPKGKKTGTITKTCSGCGKKKDSSAFSKDRTKKDGLYHLCKTCRSAYRLKNKQTNKAVKEKKNSLPKQQHNTKAVALSGIANASTAVAKSVCSVCGDALVGFISGYIKNEPVCSHCVIDNLKVSFKAKKIKKKAS